jgi:ATP-dependent Clp protease adaptor protein ClpS
MGRRSPNEGIMSDIKTATVTKVKKPSMYTVVFLNDDYTPMLFVVHLLCSIFHKSEQEAQQIMWRVHREGAAKVGYYTCEVASHKADQAMGLATLEQYPLQVFPEQID